MIVYECKIKQAPDGRQRGRYNDLISMIPPEEQIKVMYLCVVDAAEEVILFLSKAVQKIFDARSQPFPALEETLQDERDRHGNHHIQNYISGAHRVDDAHLQVGDRQQAAGQVCANKEGRQEVITERGALSAKI